MRGITKLTQFNLKLTAVWLRLIDILLSSWCTKVSLKTATVSEWSQPWSLASKQPFKMQQDHKLFALSHSNSVCATVYNNRFPQCDCSFGKSSPRTQFPLDDLAKWRLNDNNKNNSNKWRQRNVGMKQETELFDAAMIWIACCFWIKIEDLKKKNNNFRPCWHEENTEKTKILLYLRLEHTVHNVICTSKQKAATDLFLTGDFPTSSCSVVSLEVRPLFWGSWWIILTTHELGFRLFLQSLHFLSVLRPHLWLVDFRMQKTIFFTELESISLC